MLTVPVSQSSITVMVHQGADLTHVSLQLFPDAKHLPIVEARPYCPQAFAGLAFHCRMHVAESR